MPLHLEYRPDSLDKFFGNEGVKASLQSILNRSSDFPHSMLFTGPSGCGKTTLARIVALRLGGNSHDVREMNISDARGIDTARELISQMHMLPLHGPIRVFILDECQEATSLFQDAILKALEDTPDHVYFMLCTTDPGKLRRTIKTRCTMFEVSPLNNPTMRKLLKWVLDKEEYINFPTEVLDQIVNKAEGSPRQALVLLDQVIDMDDEKAMLQLVQSSMAMETNVKQLCDALLRKADWKNIAPLIKDVPTENLERVRQAVLTWCSKVLLDKGAHQAAVVVDCFSKPFYDTKQAGLVLACYQATQV